MDSLILNQFEDFFSGHGFRCLPLQREYRQEADYGFRNVVFTFGSMEDLGRLEVSIGLRLEGVERPLAPFLKGLRGYENGGNTLLFPLRLVPGAETAFSISELQSDAQKRQELSDLIENKGFPFLENCTQFKEVDRLLNHNPADDSPYSLDPFGRCIRGLVVAKLIHRQDWESLAAQLGVYLQMRKISSRYLSRYGQLRDFLRTFSLN